MCGCGSKSCAECGPAHTCGTPPSAACRACESNAARARDRIRSAQQELSTLAGCPSVPSWARFIPVEQQEKLVVESVLAGTLLPDALTEDPIARRVITALLDERKRLLADLARIPGTRDSW